MGGMNPKIIILIAEDDPDDRAFIMEGFEEAHVLNDLRFVEDGVELMDYLLHRGKYSNGKEAPRPGLILLDLNMPRMDGREALKEIKSNPYLRGIPVVVLTSSSAEEDIFRSHNEGASSYITKPVTFEKLSRFIRTLNNYWFTIVQNPTEAQAWAA